MISKNVMTHFQSEGGGQDGKGNESFTVGREAINSPDGDALNMNIENWLDRIKISIQKGRNIKVGGNFVSLSTVETDSITGQNIPKCRTVVFRGFFNMSVSPMSTIVTIKMITDSRSEKISQLPKNNNGELVWWFSQSREQYRISGKCLLVDDDAATDMQRERISMWSQISDSAREQFYWLNPGQAFEHVLHHHIPRGGRDTDGITILLPPSNFLLLLLVRDFPNPFCDYNHKVCRWGLPCATTPPY